MPERYWIRTSRWAVDVPWESQSKALILWHVYCGHTKKLLFPALAQKMCCDAATAYRSSKQYGCCRPIHYEQLHWHIHRFYFYCEPKSGLVVGNSKHLGFINMEISNSHDTQSQFWRALPPCSHCCAWQEEADRPLYRKRGEDDEVKVSDTVPLRFNGSKGSF